MEKEYIHKYEYNPFYFILTMLFLKKHEIEKGDTMKEYESANNKNKTDHNDHYILKNLVHFFARCAAECDYKMAKNQKNDREVKP